MIPNIKYFVFIKSYNNLFGLIQRELLYYFSFIFFTFNETEKTGKLNRREYYTKTFQQTTLSI